MNDKPLSFWIGVLCLAGSILTLVFQQPIGEKIGSGVMMLWLILGAVGVYFLTKDSGGGPYAP